MTCTIHSPNEKGICIDCGVITSWELYGSYLGSLSGGIVFRLLILVSIAVFVGLTGWFIG